MSRRARLITRANPHNRLKVAELLGRSALRAEWRERQAKKRKRCPACGARFAKSGPFVATVDHVVPLSKGGADDESNWQLLCRACNQAKGNTAPA